MRLEYLHPHRVYEAVDQGQADLGLVSYPEESASLAAIPWRTEPMVLVCYPQHPLAKRRSVTLEHAAQRAVRGVSRGPQDSRRDRHALWRPTKCPFAWRWRSTTSKRSSGRSKSAPASACCRSRRSRGKSRPARWFRFRIEDIALARPLGIIHRRDRKLSETAQQFIQLLQSQAAPLAEAEMPVLVAAAESNGHPANERLAASNVAS